MANTQRTHQTVFDGLQDAWIELQAVDAKRNTQRSYILDISQDLFGHWKVTRRWGRIGSKKQESIAAFKAASDRDRFVRQMLRRRQSARRRVGVAYRPVDGSANALQVFGQHLMSLQ